MLSRFLLLLLVSSLPALAQSAATSEFCSFQQTAFLNADMNNVAIFNLKQLAMLSCQSMTDQDALASAQSQIATLTQEMATVQQQLAQALAANAPMAPTTLGNTTIFQAPNYATDGGDMNYEYMTPVTTGTGPFPVHTCYLYAATGSDTTQGHFGCAVRDSNFNLLCSTSAEAPITTVQGWNQNTNFSNCVLPANGHYWVSFDKGPWGTVVTVENYNGPSTGMSAIDGTFPPYPKTLSNVQPGPQWAIYLSQ